MLVVYGTVGSDGCQYASDSRDLVVLVVDIPFYLSCKCILHENVVHNLLVQTTNIGQQSMREETMTPQHMAGLTYKRGMYEMTEMKGCRAQEDIRRNGA